MEKPKKKPELKFFADYTPEPFSSEERKILKLFFSNIDKPAFVVSGLPETVIGALIARHSMSPGSMRRVFLSEFIKNKRALLRFHVNFGCSSKGFNLTRAEFLLKKSLVGFGHDSLGASIPLVLGFEDVSQLGVKGVEDARIGLGPIERSTRYGFFARKKDGRYPYARSPVIMNSRYAHLYEQEIDANLDLYTQLQKPVAEAYRKKFPDANDWQIRRMTFDTTRVLLVAANLTNFGVMVNAQAMAHLIIKLKASELTEHQELGLIIEQEVRQLAPVLVARIGGDFGRKAIRYLIDQREKTKILADKYLSKTKPTKVRKGAKLVGHDPKGEDKVMAKILWPRCDLSNQQVLKMVRQLSDRQKGQIISQYLGKRPDRRVKPGRAFEEAVLSYQLVCRFAEWRDLQRHRILTPYWRRFDCRLGFDIGDDLDEFGYGSLVKKRLEKLAESQAKIGREYPVEAQYMVPFGALVPYLVTLNFRELIHLAELRTGPGAHPGYAKVAFEMANQAKEVYPLLGRAFQFVNWR